MGCMDASSQEYSQVGVLLYSQIPHEESFHASTNMPDLKSMVVEKKNG